MEHSKVMGSGQGAGAVQHSNIMVEDEISLTEIITALLKHIRLIVFTPIIFALLAATVTFIRGKSYTAESAFTLTAGTSSSSRIASLAAQFGVQAGGGSRPAESLDFYVALLQSREVLGEVVLSEYVIPVSPGSPDSVRGTLIELSGIEIEPGIDPLPRAIRALKGQISVKADQMSSLITIETSAPLAALAEQINRHLLDIVNRFNIERRTSQAAIERAFIEERLEAAKTKLREAEAALEEFLLRNRSFNTPTLAFEQSRLQHQVELQRQLYITLAQAHETAQIEEVRNTPLISIIDPPEGSARGQSRLKLHLLLGLVLGGFIAIGAALVLEMIRRAREDDPETFADVDELRRTAMRRVLYFWRSEVAS